MKTPILLLALPLCAAFAEEGFDESSFFQDTAKAAAPSTGAVKTDSVAAVAAGAKVSFSGDLWSTGQASWRRGGLDTTGGSGAQLVGDATVEARLSTGSRALATFEVDHDATGDSSSFHVREMFVDGNVGGVLWLRGGKQVLQWGRGILWTPTDLVNVEGRTLVARAGAREGASGLRLQVPVGQTANLYGFVNLAHVSASDSLSAAWRAEAAVGPAEVAVSGWHKKDAPTALGIDGSTGILGWDVQAGALWLSGDLQARPVVDGSGYWNLARDDSRQQVRAGGGIGRSFTVLGVPDRLRLDFEGLWQSDPLGSGVLKDRTRRDWAPAFQGAPTSLVVNGVPVQVTKPSPSTDESGFMLAHGLYTPNQLSWGYLAGMASFQQFVVQDLTLTLQALGNLEDGSGLGTAALSWRTFRGFSVSLTGYWFWGRSRDEETFLSGSGPAVEARMGVAF
jgi:hypothetical protein